LLSRVNRYGRITCAENRATTRKSTWKMANFKFNSTYYLVPCGLVISQKINLSYKLGINGFLYIAIYKS
jgi:hypothetical protein